MKTISLLITLVILFSFGAGVLAQETELPDPGLTPDSTFYFLETIAEEIGTFFTLNAKTAIENAMGVSVRGHEKAVEALKAKDALGEVPEEVSLPEVVPVGARERIQRNVELQEHLEENKDKFPNLE